MRIRFLCLSGKKQTGSGQAEKPGGVGIRRKRKQKLLFFQKCAVHGGVEQFFRMFDAVAVPEGCIALRDGGQVRTVYTSGCDLERGLYYYTTYESHRIRCVSLCREHLDGTVLACYPLRREADIQTEN